MAKPSRVHLWPFPFSDLGPRQIYVHKRGGHSRGLYLKCEQVVLYQSEATIRIRSQGPQSHRANVGEAPEIGSLRNCIRVPAQP